MNKKRYISPETVIIDVMDEELIASTTMTLSNDTDDDYRCAHEERGSSIWD